MGKVVKVKFGAADQLRAIADQMDRGEIVGNATVIVDKDVFYCAPQDLPFDQAAAFAVFDCNYAIAKLMAGAMEIINEP